MPAPAWPEPVTAAANLFPSAEEATAYQVWRGALLEVQDCPKLVEV